MLTELCNELKNWFDETYDGERCRYFGTFHIENGSIDLIGTGIQEGQYYRIVGSVFNDGVHQHPASDLTDETFIGSVWAMAIPQEVIALSDEIDQWVAKYQTPDSAAMSPFNSESFGGYSYSKGSSASSSGTSSAQSGTWQSQFASRLNKWRKIRAI